MNFVTSTHKRDWLFDADTLVRDGQNSSSNFGLHQPLVHAHTRSHAVFCTYRSSGMHRHSSRLCRRWSRRGPLMVLHHQMPRNREV